MCLPRNHALLQVDSRERDLITANEAAGTAGGRITAAESELARLKEALRVSEGRASASLNEVGALRSQLQVGRRRDVMHVTRSYPVSYPGPHKELVAVWIHFRIVLVGSIQC